MSSPRLRSLLTGLLVCLPLLLPAFVHAQTQPHADGGTDAGGGTDSPDNPEGEDGTGHVPTACRSSNDCAPRFTCASGTCKYTGVRKAETEGCMLGPEAALVLVGLAAVAVPRRRGRN
jgi:hypothetical protein